MINGQTHYGWARLNIKLAGTNIGCQYEVALAGFAFETIANKPITTGETKGPAEMTSRGDLAPQPSTASLGALAMGSRGLSVWRREEEAESNR
jgi:hypothetical protein